MRRVACGVFVSVSQFDRDGENRRRSAAAIAQPRDQLRDASAVVLRPAFTNHLAVAIHEANPMLFTAPVDPTK
jgi:hypothetical protein